MADRIAEIRAARYTLRSLAAADRDIDYLLDELARVQGAAEELQTKLTAAERQNRELDRSLDQVIGERDNYHDIADKLAYAVAPEEVIGEHSSMNCPWENALDLVTPKAEVDELRQKNADLRAELVARDHGVIA